MKLTSLFSVEKLTPADLLKALKDKGQRDQSITKNVICSKLEDKDDEISTTSCKVSMACPLGMARYGRSSIITSLSQFAQDVHFHFHFLNLLRMTLPCRASTCDHLQCFDADLYLKMNEKKPKWVCPVCNKPAYFKDLFLDGFYIQLLLSPKFKALTTNDIILNNDASWEPVEDIVEGVSDSEDEEEQRAQAALRLAEANREPVTLDDDDDISVIPITPMGQVDKDGAPIMYANPAANRQPPRPPNNSLFDEDDDVLQEKSYPPETDYMDWNFSVKFFQFSRDPPPPPRELTPPTEGGEGVTEEPSDSGSSRTVSSREDYVQQRGRPSGRGAGRGRGRGAGKRPAPYVVPASSDEEDIEPPMKVVNGSARGRGGKKAAAARKKAPAKKKTKRKASSEEDNEDLSNSDSEAPPPPPPARTSSRPARNSRKITNYAALEDSGDVLDYFLGSS